MASSSKQHDPINETVLTTPRPKATSTVSKSRKFHPRACPEDPSATTPSTEMDSSRDDFDLSNICHELEAQCSMPSESLLRASQKVGLPSMYLRSCETTTSSSNTDFLTGSTISDLSVDKNNCSTPRQSILLSQALEQLSLEMTDPSVNLDNFDERFRKIRNESHAFNPTEEANDILNQDTSNSIYSQLAGTSSGDVSIGKYFLKRSDSLSSIISNVSSSESKILIDATNHHPSVSNETDHVAAIQKSLISVSAIENVLRSDYPTDVAMKLLENQAVRTKLPVSIVASPEPSFSRSHNVNKENESAVKSPGSSRSSSRALSSLPEGKLPMDSTASELVWGCVKIGKCVTQEFCIRNKSDKRLGLQLSVSGHEFKIRKDPMVEVEGMSTVKIIMKALESKVISVSFLPTKLGAAADQIAFRPLEPMEQTKKQSIKLYGYGGHSTIEYYNVTKDSAGKYWLSLGKIGDNCRITKKFSVRNTGTLPSFVYVSVTDKIFSPIKVISDFLILLPQEEKEVVVDYILNMDSYKKFLCSETAISEVGNLCIFTGTEANRGRLRRLYRKLNENGSPENSLGCILVHNIRDEVMPPDLTKMRENVNAYIKILQLVNKTEMGITIEKDPDQTIIALPEETMFYQTLCEGESVMDTTASNSSFNLEPTIIVLTPPKKLKDFLYFTSNVSKPVQFKVCCEPKGLKISPDNGQINNGQDITITLRYSKNVDCTNFTVKVYVEEEVLEASVKIRGN